MKKILVNKNIWQTRVAVLNEEKLQDVYFDTSHQVALERSFFKGKVLKVLPGIQTAFIDIGMPKAGFLHISEIDRVLATERVLDHLQLDDDDREEVSAREIKSSIDIGKIFHEGEMILVQVTKEPISEKGAKLSTCFTLPGKFVVLMPNIPHIGVSKKIESKEERTRLKEFFVKHLPKGMGAIVRTTSLERSEKDLAKDLAILVSTWHAIQKKFKKTQVVEQIYEDIPVTLRVIRDHLDEDVEMVIIDDEKELTTLHKFTKHVTPEHADKLRLYNGSTNLFDRFHVDEQIENALQKKVQLKSGGSIIIESTEAMTVIDVNTGKFTGSDNHEDTILKTNTEAALEIVDQLRLRNIGGLIVIDFIDMGYQANRQKLSRILEKTLRERDKFQSVALKISEFGLVQMTRKRSGKTLIAQLMEQCTACSGNGHIRSIPSISFQLLSSLKEELTRGILGNAVAIFASEKVCDYLINRQYQAILALEKLHGCKVSLEAKPGWQDSQFNFQRTTKKSNE